MQFKILSILIISFLFIGCSQKINNYAKLTDLLHEQALTSTQKVIIKEKNNVKAYLTVTYLSQIKQDKIELNEEVETFLVGVYNPAEDKKKDFFNISTVKINGIEQSFTTLLKDDDPVLDIISFKNPWSTYLLVEAPKDSTKNGVTIEIFVEDIGSTKLSFHDSYGNLPMGSSVGFKTTKTSD